MNQLNSIYVNGTHGRNQPVYADSYVLIFGKQDRVVSVQQFLWENGILGYISTQTLPAGTIKLRRGLPGLLLVYMDDLSTDAMTQIEQLCLQKSIPLLCIVALGWHESRLRSMMDLATDFIRAPLDPSELLLRLERLGDAPRVHAMPGRSDNTPHSALVRPKRVRSLSPVEAEILSVLEQNLGTTVDFERLSRCVGGETLEQRINTLRVHVLRMRRKLEPNPKQPKYIINERAVGYRLAKPIEVEASQ